MFVAWVLFPLVLLAVCVGCGLTVELIAGWALPGGLLPSVGLATVVVLATLTTSVAETATLTTAVVVAIALVGYAAGRRRTRGFRLEPWMVAVGLGVFALCAAPVVLSGHATFAGYFVDNDPAYHFALIDQLLARGHNLSGVAPSPYSAVVETYLGTGYPIGADVALGAVRPLVAQNVAWLFQPFLATILAFGSVALYELLSETVRARPLRAACAVIPTLAGLVYAFYLEGSIKELVTAGLITVTVCLVFATLRRPVTPRRTLPLLITVIAALDVLQLAVVPWIGIPVAAFVVICAWRARIPLHGRPTHPLVLESAAVVGIAGLLAAPVVVNASTFFSTATGVLGTSGPALGSQLGNLAGPLQKWQILGIWPTGDFRLALGAHYGRAYALMGVALASAVLGAVWMVRRRRTAPLLLLVSSGLAAVYLLGRSSPYAASKVMMLASLAIVLSAMLGAAALYDIGRRVEASVLAAIIAFGVLWTDALAYQGVSLAPRDRLAELAMIGTRFKGDGPTFYNQADEFALPFLREESPTAPGVSGPLPPVRPGLPARGEDQVRLPWDPSELAFPYMESFRLLVLGRSPLASRPPANFELVYRGRYYTVWRRTTTPKILEHVALGSGLFHTAVPGCSDVMAIAGQAARRHAQLAYSEGTPDPAMVPTEGAQTPGWAPVAGNPYEVIPVRHAGIVAGSLRVARAGRYQVWFEASLNQHVSVAVGNHHVASLAYELGPPGQFLQIGEVSLQPGSQRVTITPSGSALAPGQTADDQFLGPVVLVSEGDSPRPLVISPHEARSLCGRPLSWVEVVG